MAALGWISGPIYESRYVEALEASFILNICVLSVASYHVTNLEANELHVTYVSVSIAFAEFVGILIFHMFQRIANTNCFDKIRSQHLKSLERHFRIMMKRDKRSLSKNNQTTVVAIEREEQVMMAIREPLLED